jgi:hypothetical protein
LKFNSKKRCGPIALPIFFNGEKIPEPQKITAYQAIDNLIDRLRKIREQV